LSQIEEQLLTEADLDKVEELELWENRAELARVDSWAFLKYFARTADEHDPAHVYKPFPIRGYLRIIDRVFDELQIAYIEKTGQMKLTWVFVGKTLHNAMFQNSRLIADQSENQKKANAVLGRQKHMYRGLVDFAPLFEKSGGPPIAKEVNGKFGSDTELEFPQNNSKIIAIPQGKDAVQSYTWSIIFADELNLQPKSGEGYAAAAPSIGGGGRWFGVSRANGHTWGYFIREGIDYETGKRVGRLLLDSRFVETKPIKPPAHFTEEQQRWYIEKALLDMDDEKFKNIPLLDLIACCPGMRMWQYDNGMPCIQVHYKADPYKDPITTLGAEWYKAERKLVTTQAHWDQHYEIQYDAFVGRRVITNFSIPLHVRKPEYDSNSMLYLSMDFGANCGCAFAHYTKIPDYHAERLSIIDEIYLESSDTHQLAKEVRKRLEGPYYRSWQNNYIRAFCDPAGHIGDATVSDKSLNTSIKILQSVGIYPYTKKFGVPESTEVLEMVFGLILPDGKPAVELHERCIYLIGCCQNLHFPENGRQGYYEKDGKWDHGGDILRYLIKNVFDYIDLAPTGMKQNQERAFEYKRRKYTGEIIGVRRLHNLRRISPQRTLLARRRH